MKKQILSLLFFLIIAAASTSQSCYNNTITDLSGINPGSTLTELETISCKLRDSIGSNFTVYEGAVYRHSSKFNEGIEPYVQGLISEVQSKSDYYILIVKIASDLDVFERVYVNLKLPQIGNYACISREFPNFASNLQNLIESNINAEILGESSIDKFSAIVKGLKLMSEKLTTKKLCCLNANRSNSCSDCDISKSQVITDLIINKFILYPDSFAVSSGSTSTYPSVYTNLSFTFDSLSRDQLVTEFLSNSTLIGENNAKIIISDDQIYCNPIKLAEAKSIFNSPHYCLWIHINLNGTSFELPAARSNNFGKLYYKSNGKFGPIQCGEGWSDDDDAPTYKSTKQPYKKIEYETVAKNYDDVLFYCYKNSTNSSSGALQKNAWSNKWDNGFQGTAGEAECMRIYNLSIPAGTGIYYYKQTKDFVGAVTQAAAATALTRIEHAPDKYTDFVVYLANAGATNFNIKCIYPMRSLLYNDLSRWRLKNPPYKIRKTGGVGQVLVEVKTVGSKNAYEAILKGISQLKNNPLVSFSMPIVAIDDKSLRIMLSTLPDSALDDLVRELSDPIMIKGGIDSIDGLNCGTISRLQNLINEIRNHQDQKPPIGYY
ncbi:MAG: hypothetical protein RLZZ546_1277 [Bacteroidota bacterium]|jgi:hypothetical protein